MKSPNLGLARPLDGNLVVPVRGLIRKSSDGEGLAVVAGEEAYVSRVAEVPLSSDLAGEIQFFGRRIGVTKNFREVVDYFKTPADETPAGFRIDFELDADGVVRADLVRDISYDKNGRKRATNFLFSADSADPYEVAEIKDLLANLTCNPGIIYDLFINNPKANIGGKFKTRDEVMTELGRVLGPGCDISVELNNPFEEDVNKLLDEAAKFREILSPYRVVIKVPHTGPVNSKNYGELLTGDKKFSKRFDAGSTKDMLRGHNLALLLREHGYRINFTLMFEPYQTALALQAKPYFINSFIRHRQSQSADMKQLLDLYKLTDDPSYLQKLRTFMVDKDFLASGEKDADLLAVKKAAERTLAYRGFDKDERNDGLDAVRHNLRLLRQCNLPETRLIICSMEGDYNYPDIDKLLTEPEFEDMMDRIVITAAPEYLARFTSCNHVVSYQRRFMNAANGAK